MPLLKSPSRHNNPIIILMPPYRPATSEYPITSLTFKPTASIKDGTLLSSSASLTGSIIAQAPIPKYKTA
tara:strand:+ start:1416 stop:1625 length:210 start_codon:yes stop_codon:yes gene_type:complete